VADFIKFQANGAKLRRASPALFPNCEEDAYPEPTMFGEIPAYGVFIRHVKGLTMTDVEIG
jgi:hypothetical protein